MAELTGDRAQLLLVGALAIAVAMVALSLLLNSAIFAQNLATQDIDTGSHDAVQYRNTSVEAIKAIVDDETDEEYTGAGGTTGQHKVSKNVTRSIKRYANLSRRASLSETRYATINESTLSATNGTLLRQTDQNPFESDGSDGNWTLSEGVSNIRRFSLVVESIEATSHPPNGDAFNVTLAGNSGGGDQWSVYIYQNGGTPTVSVKNGSDPVTTDVCSPGASTPVTVNLTAGTVNGQSCPPLSFAEGTSSPHNINFTNGTNAEGTYNLTVDTTTGITGFNPVGSGQPYEVPAVYSVEADVLYETPRLRYNDTVRVAPGEPE